MSSKARKVQLRHFPLSIIKNKIHKIFVGSWVRVKFDDAGAMDGIITDQVERSYTVFLVADFTTQTVEKDQIVQVGKRLSCKNNGLD